MASGLTQVGPSYTGQAYEVKGNDIITAAKNTVTKIIDFLTNNAFVNLFRVNDKIFSLPVVKGTEGEIGIDVTKLRDASTANAVAFDASYGLGNIAYPSAVTFINGEIEGEGILNYRGYNIKELTEKASFTEVAYLLFNDKLPNAEELQKFEEDVKAGMALDPKIIEMIKSLPNTVHPMNILSGAVAALEGFTKKDDRKDYAKNFALLVGRVLAVTGFLNRKVCLGANPQFPNIMPGRDVVDNFMRIMFGGSVLKEGELYEIKKRVIDKLLILHADHEQNCSTFTGRVVASSGAGPFAATAAAINALYGPSHGGANQAALEELEGISKVKGPNGEELTMEGKVNATLEAFKLDDAERQRAKKESDYKAQDHNLKRITGHHLLMGFGHRVYKTRDPRASVIENTCRELFNNPIFEAKLDPQTKDLLNLAKAFENKALTEPYCKEKKLFPNVDFYSGIVYKALGISTEMFTPMFAAGRTPGWLTHMQEQIKADKIIRPRQIYLGKTLKDREALPADKKPGVPIAA